MYLQQLNIVYKNGKSHIHFLGQVFKIYLFENLT